MPPPLFNQNQTTVGICLRVAADGADINQRTPHEPKCRAGVSPASVGNADGMEPLALARSLGRRDACPTLGPARFMVPMHAQKRMEAPPH